MLNCKNIVPDDNMTHSLGVLSLNCICLFSIVFMFPMNRLNLISLTVVKHYILDFIILMYKTNAFIYNLSIFFSNKNKKFIKPEAKMFCYLTIF